MADYLELWQAIVAPLLSGARDTRQCPSFESARFITSLKFAGEPRLREALEGLDRHDFFSELARNARIFSPNSESTN
jgi:hypothetical protein